MPLLLSTSVAATLLRLTEPRLNDLIRRGKVIHLPHVVAGRRLWSPEHVLQAAEALGRLTRELRSKLDAMAAGPGRPNDAHREGDS